MSQRLAPLHYFAYGSNMNPERVTYRKLSTKGVPEPGLLHNYELRFNKISRYRVGAASANIAPVFGCSVAGVLYRLTSSSVIKSMDVFENSPEDYAREVVFVHTYRDTPEVEVRLVPAWTYVAKPHAIDDSLRPTREYVGHLLASPFMTESERTRLLALDCHDA
ncbi:MAG: gamma-glutamylcyclotransferase [Gammaproteobacteria bacterium]|nr:gamma-glutamylcyclotransferase [Gammaproteobacteria bacterium]